MSQRIRGLPGNITVDTGLSAAEIRVVHAGKRLVDVHSRLGQANPGGRSGYPKQFN
jgi:hypothetical protein